MSNIVAITASTRLINTITDEWGIRLSDIKRKFPYVIWGSIVTEDMLGSLGFMIVEPTVPPVGDIIKEVKPLLTEQGQYIQQWEVTSFSEDQLASKLSERRAMLLSEVDMLQERALAIGVPFNFGTADKPVIQNIQIRDGDRANHVGISKKFDRDPAIELPFRTYQDNIFILKGDDIVAVTDRAYDGYLEILGAIWQLKDAIKNATGEATLPTTPDSVTDFFTNILKWEVPTS